MIDEDAYLQILVNVMPMELECAALVCAHGMGGARWKTPPLSEPAALQVFDAHMADAHPVGGGEDVRDEGVGGAVHDEGDEDDLSEWSWPNSNLQEIPRPVLQRRCSKEDFDFFRRKWLRYVRYYEKVDANEIRDQLLNCPDTALKEVVYISLGSDVDTITQAEAQGV